MHFYIAIASVLLPLIGAASSSGPVPGFDGSDARIEWRPCSPQTGLDSPRNGISSFDCGELSVPLDYTNESSSERLTLHLRRLLARKQPSVGSILLNYGGLGDSMSSSFFESAPGQQNIVGPEFDLVALQPRRVPVSAMNEMTELIVLNRGTGDTIPFTCYNDKPLDKEHHFNSHIATRNMTTDEK
ncbi:hypothetical protein B9Z65_1357 [Elsinoe australis]|uniref:Uncharacterized protein n=1 Tax=Elsinoe australis TaxID=40998 RepID=A0A2P7YFP8_9PEZI|nr:hypothetical protein B9Z65_1357 [Elsinoe australis]